MSPRESPKGSQTQNAAFHTTRWSVVLAAQEKGSPDGSQSLEALCQRYWPPLCAYLRHRGFAPHDAEDLTQEFFARLLEKEWLAAVKRECGRFRSFLLMALKRFIANEWDRSQARKRGGGCEVISLDGVSAESIYAGSSTAALPAESLYEKRWALTLLETVMQRLKARHDTVSEGGVFHSSAGRIVAGKVSPSHIRIALQSLLHINK